MKGKRRGQYITHISKMETFVDEDETLTLNLARKEEKLRLPRRRDGGLVTARVIRATGAYFSSASSVYLLLFSPLHGTSSSPVINPVMASTKEASASKQASLSFVASASKQASISPVQPEHSIRRTLSSASLRNNRFASLDSSEDEDDDDSEVPPPPDVPENSMFFTPSGKRILRERPVPLSTKAKEMQAVVRGRGNRGRGSRGGRG
ncbi:unnamed protein product [Microthlaspi erraticum]|uniref:Uncharacterized protein n=1 Tax=Microthlaspi erraticum TaxID=1685480 RepID=A0A6D2HZZ3_9BRAS|nr:unnamed protein product [Microthlaspi erraticum]CAA7052221.1 unnamed protein product [Microthlaspi erraticum]